MEGAPSDKYMYSDRESIGRLLSRIASEQIMTNYSYQCLPLKIEVSTLMVSEGSAVDTTLIKPTEGTYKGYTLTTDMLVK